MNSVMTEIGSRVTGATSSVRSNLQFAATRFSSRVSSVTTEIATTTMRAPQHVLRVLSRHVGMALGIMARSVMKVGETPI